ncbi:MAG: branched-chain amino acid ABC transporter permease [Candidatus Bathyarchaeia archaeon]
MDLLLTIIQAVVNGFLTGGVYSLIAIGLTLIFGVSKIINFAHGEYLMVAMYLTFWLYTIGRVDPYISILISMPTLFIMGMLTQKIFVEPLARKGLLSQTILVTLGLSITMQNVALFFWSADYRSVRTAYSGATIEVAGVWVSLPRLIAFISAFVTASIFMFFLLRTYTGRSIRAVAQDPETASLMGINVSRAGYISFGLGSALVAIAGAVMMPVYYVFPTVGSVFGLMAFVIVVLGGLGSFVGAFLGGLIIGQVESLTGVFFRPEFKEAGAFLIFMFILFFKPTGLFGKYAWK